MSRASTWFALSRMRIQRAVLAVALVLFSGAAFAQLCNVEVEPNDTPPTATPLAALGPDTGGQLVNSDLPITCLAGELGSNDQDAFVWTVDEVGALHSWTLEVEGTAGALTQIELYQVTFTEDGQGVTAADNLLRHGTNDGRWSVSEPFLVAPGSYIVGLSGAGGAGEYVAYLRPRALAADAQALRPERVYTGSFDLFAASGTATDIPFEIDDEAAAFAWTISLQAALGSSPSVSIEGPAGKVTQLRFNGPGPSSMSNLGLAPGEYVARVEPASAPAAGPLRLTLSSAGRFSDGVEIEPNDSFQTATRFPLGGSMSGVVEDPDFFRIDVDAEQAATTWTLSLEASSDVQLELYDADETLLQQRRGVSGTSTGLVLAAGHYYLRLSGGGTPEYIVGLAPGAAIADGHEREPNDRVASANRLGPEGQVRGELAGQDQDVFALNVTGEAQLYRLQVVGSGVGDLALLDAAGSRAAGAAGERRIRLDDLTLLPGTHYVSVSGSGGEYALKALSLGPAPAPVPEAPAAAEARPADEPLIPAVAAKEEQDVEAALAEPAAAELPPLPAPPPGVLETEPNDSNERAGRLLPGVAHVGRLSTRSDADHYRFYLANDQYVRLELVPAEGDPSIPFNLAGTYRQPTSSELGAPIVVEQWMLAGSHSLDLQGRYVLDGAIPGIGTGYYQLRLTLLGPLYAPADFEPNDSADEAAAVPAELHWSGLLGESRDEDYYRLPVFEAVTTMSVAIESDLPVEVYAYADDERLGIVSEDSGQLSAELPAETVAYLRLRGSGRYQVALAFADTASGASVLTLPKSNLEPRAAGELDVTLELDTDEIAAFWHEGQRFSGTVTVSNSGTADTTVTLTGAAGDARVTVEAVPKVAVPAGASVTTPITVSVPSDMTDSAPLAVQVATLSEAGRAISQSAVALRCEAAPVGVFDYWPLPPELLGLPDMLYSGFGADLAGESGFERRDRVLIDGRTSLSYAGWLEPEHAPTFLLAGGESVELIGTTLHPQGNSSVGDQLRDFSIETSLDGVTFSKAFEGELVAARFEQAFVFDEPVTARYARLVYGSSQNQGRGGAYVGEWRLLAADPGLVSGRNLLAPEVGGHVVWSRPLLSNSGVGLLVADDSAGRVDLRDHDELTFVTSFHNGRAAKVSSIAWREVGGQPVADAFFEHLKLEVSLAGPAGPWQALGEWELARDAAGAVQLDLAEPTWARFLKFTAPKPEGMRYIDLPSQVAVLETPVSDAYLSALGEWGPGTNRGPLEFFAATQDAPLVELDADNDTMAGATPLESGKAVTGTVAITEDIDWYKISLTEGENSLELRLQGDPSIGYVHELVDAQGEPVLHDVVDDGESIVITAFLEAGDYYLRLEEPKRSVIFSWDTSGSVSPYRAVTYSSLAGFARDVDGDREAVQLLAFNAPQPLWLLPYWSSDPARVQRSIAEFDPRRADSSNSELALLTAARALAQREGTKAILFMTDAETSGYGLTPELWEALEVATPRVFTFEISSGGSDYSQDLMQDWAAVNAGTYAMVDGVGEFGDGFARASCLLRRPKRYTVEVTTGYREPPGPGTLSVVPSPNAGSPGVHVIFDASGSMGQALPSGEQRIVAAKRALEDLVGGVLEEGTPFSLRAFGHVAPNSCETNLDVPLGPLEPAAALAAVDAISPKLLSQTAIADSLRLAVDDLSKAVGQRTVILITDGKESCGGDPAAAAAELRNAGATSIAIVSLALDPESLAVFEELAAEIGASYVDVGSFEALKEAIDAALKPGFEVYDAAGALVASGRVGDSVELPMGLYRVRVLSAPAEVFENVRVPGDGSVRVETGGR